LSVALRRELAACFRALASDRDVCAMVLTGAGTAFCAGMDRSEFGGDADHRRDLFESSKELFASLGELPIPAIAAINGPALGGGSALAASCDIRLASPATRLGHPEVALGIPASYAALLAQRLEDDAGRGQDRRDVDHRMRHDEHVSDQHHEPAAVDRVPDPAIRALLASSVRCSGSMPMRHARPMRKIEPALSAAPAA